MEESIKSYIIISLETILNPPNDEHVPNNAFACWMFAKEAHLPVAKTIGDNAFLRCALLSIINLPQAETIGTRAFSGCTAATKIYAPKA